GTVGLVARRSNGDFVIGYTQAPLSNAKLRGGMRGRQRPSRRGAPPYRTSCSGLQASAPHFVPPMQRGVPHPQMPVACSPKPEPVRKRSRKCASRDQPQGSPEPIRFEPPRRQKTPRKRDSYFWIS